MHQKFEIRLATETDLPTIFSLVKSLADHVGLSHEITATEDDLGNHLFGDARYVDVLIGYVESSPVAMIIFYPGFSTFMGKPSLHIEDFYIRPEFRGCGLGTAIFKYLVKIADSRGCGKIEWYATEWNEGAIRFYQKMGACKLNERKLFRLSADAMRALMA
ncbi:MAG: GNAT family N-acetyltransferase [Deltaproteobacteria bacterium]|nr:GNAT family N-acetyltransferase [Deltaproteobacteria bacterium]